MNLDQWTINQLAELATDGDKIVSMLSGIFILFCAVSIIVVVGLGIALDRLDEIIKLLQRD